MVKEDKNLEFKEYITNTFLKTVSAYANYDGGTIIFGVNDTGDVSGLDDLKTKCLDIENRINDSIKPQPEYSLSANNKEGTISLKIQRGSHQPYLYKAKAYKRNDTSTIEVDDIELTRLVLEGKHLSYEELTAKEQDFSFSILSRKLKEQKGLENFNKDVLKTLGLYSDKGGYNNAAAILADKNKFSGIDIAKFGDTISVIKKRSTFSNKSILSAYDEAVSIYRDYYKYELVDGAVRKTVETIPESAFREAIANAAIHRVWDVKSNIRVLMFEDRIEVISPGGLSNEINKNEYIEGKVSVLRNPILANVFNRLNLAETFGTGIRRIKESYSGSVSQPVFDVTDNTIQVTLPVISEEIDLSSDERTVYNVLSKAMAKSISDIMTSDTITFGKSKVTSLLKSMAEKRIIKIEGIGRGTKYRII